MEDNFTSVSVQSKVGLQCFESYLQNRKLKPRPLKFTIAKNTEGNSEISFGAIINVGLHLLGSIFIRRETCYHNYADDTPLYIS